MASMAKNSVSKAQDTFRTWLWPIVLYSAVAGCYFATYHGKFVWFSWHPLCMFISFVALPANAILVKKIGGYDNTMLHGYLLGAATILGLFAWYVIYSNKEMQNKGHLYTNHGQLGFVVLVGNLGIALFGAVGLNPAWGIVRTNKTLRAVHKWAGKALVALSWVVVVLGILTMQKTNVAMQAVFCVPLVVFGWLVLL